MPDVNDEDTDLRWAELQRKARAEEEQSLRSDRPTPEDKAEAFLAMQLQEVRRQQAELNRKYPYADGDRTVLGPEVFTDGAVICWKGKNYVPQEQVAVLRSLRAVCAIHLRAMVELMEDKGIGLSDSALRLFMILNDELTLTLPALAEAHPAVLPRLPEGME
jgi:hypothetical protein